MSGSIRNVSKTTKVSSSVTSSSTSSITSAKITPRSSSRRRASSPIMTHSSAISQKMSVDGLFTTSNTRWKVVRGTRSSSTAGKSFSSTAVRSYNSRLTTIPFLSRPTRAPDTAKIKQKMLFASSKEALRRSLVGIATEIQATDVSEVSHETGTYPSALSSPLDPR